MKRVPEYSPDDLLLFESCTLCPRECRVNRLESNAGYCGLDAGLNIASICIHRGEEPVISGQEGICNIFFAGCNLHCAFCQNYEISYDDSAIKHSETDMQSVLSQISGILEKGVTSVGFVSPSHVVPQVKAIIKWLRSKGFKGITVYNTNSYEKPETIRSLSGLIDVFLPDYKYVNPELASEFSDAYDYPEVALKVLKEMYYQKGSVLTLDEDGRAENGMLIRHLVLPGHAEESKKLIRSIAEELSPGVHLSLMSQYHPTFHVKAHPVLNRGLYKEEYESVVAEMEDLGFRNGWIQDLDSFQNYIPDFSKKDPF